MERLFIVNRWSGKGKGFRYEKLIQYWYAKRGIEPIIWPTAEIGPDTAFNLGKKAALEGCNPVCVVGGDGTANSVVNGVIASGICSEQFPTFGFIQAGTGNNFAKNAGIPKNLVGGLEAIEYGKVARVDIGKLTMQNKERYFLNTVSFGFDAWITALAEKSEMKKFVFPPKESHYLLAALGEITRGMKSYKISVNGRAPKEMILVAIANGPTYGAIFRIAPGANLQDGLLDVCCIDCVGKFRALQNITKVLQGTHASMPEVTMSRISSLTISSPENLPCQIDGEVLPAQKEYKIKVLPGILKILVPSAVLSAKIPLYIQSVQTSELQSA